MLPTFPKVAMMKFSLCFSGILVLCRQSVTKFDIFIFDQPDAKTQVNNCIQENDSKIAQGMTVLLSLINSDKGSRVIHPCEYDGHIRTSPGQKASRSMYKKDRGQYSWPSNILS